MSDVCISRAVATVQDGETSSFFSARFEVSSVYTGTKTAGVSLILTGGNGCSWRVAYDTVASDGDYELVLNRTFGNGWSVTMGDLVAGRADRVISSKLVDRAWAALNGDFLARKSIWINALDGVVSDALAVAGIAAQARTAAAGVSPAELDSLRDRCAALETERDNLAAQLAATVSNGQSASIELVQELSAAMAEIASLKSQLDAVRGPVVVRHPAFESVAAALSLPMMPVWLYGPAGTGKSALCEQIAAEMGWSYYCTGSILDEYSGLKGFIDANGLAHKTEFVRALDDAAAGRDVLICFDEADGSIPEVMLCLNNLLAGGVVEACGVTYRANDHLHVVACGNTCGRGGDGTYTRQIIDAATLDRFAMVEINYARDIELSIAHGDGELVDFVDGMRTAAAAAHVDLLVTYRAVGRLYKLAGALDMARALDMGFVRGMSRDSLASLIAAALDGGMIDGSNRWFAALSDIADGMPA